MADLIMNARDSRLGRDLTIGERVTVGAIGGEAQSVEIGDNVFIGDDVRILAPRVRIGDFTTIHHHTTIYGYDQVSIGAGCWIGQNVVLNCTAPLTIGRGCTLSAYCNIWTHFSGGDPIAGCRFNRRQYALIGDDVWIGVQATLAPVSIGDRALVLAGAVVTKDIPSNTTWGGNPAADLTAKLGAPYVERPVADKFEDMVALAREFHASLRTARSFDSGLGDEEFSRRQSDGTFTLGGITITMQDMAEDGTSIFDVRDRTYSKLRTPEELGFMYFLLPLIKFYPRREGQIIQFR